MSEEKEKSGLELLMQPFPKEMISFLPKPMVKATEYKKLPRGTCKVCGGYHATSKTMHLSYVGHAALTLRLLQVDTTWKWEPMSLNDVGLPLFDESGGLWIRLTICGVTRLGYGHAKENPYAEVGSRTKEIIGDALRNGAMRFGAALDLWSKADLAKVYGNDTDIIPEEKAPSGPDKISVARFVDGLDFFAEPDKTIPEMDKWFAGKSDSFELLSENDKMKVTSYKGQLQDSINEQKSENNSSTYQDNL